MNLFVRIVCSHDKGPELRSSFLGVVYYESMKRELKTRPIYECRCHEKLKTKAEESTRLVYNLYNGLLGDLEHLKIKTRLTNEKFASVKGECEI